VDRPVNEKFNKAMKFDKLPAQAKDTLTNNKVLLRPTLDYPTQEKLASLA